jgi:hypothetical protein
VTKPLVRLAITASLGVILLPAPLLACPVCFGQTDSPLARGMSLGILFLLGVTGVVLGSFAAFFVYLIRRARLIDRERRSRLEDPLTCSNS